MSKPSNIDAQRIMAVLEETYFKLEAISYLTPEILEKIEETNCIAELYSSEDQQLLESHGLLEKCQRKKFQLLNANEDDELSSNGSQYNQSTDNLGIEEIRDSLIQTTTQLLSKFKYDDNLLNTVKNLNEKDSRSEGVKNLIETFKNLASLVLKKLMTPQEEENRREQQIKEIDVKLTKDKEIYKKEENKFKKISQDKESATVQRGDVISKLNVEKKDIEENKADNMTKITKTSEQIINETTDKHKSEMEKLDVEIKKLEKQLGEKKESNKMAEKKLRDEKKRREDLLRSTIDEYDQFMLENREIIDEERKKYEQMQKDLTDFEEHFSKIDAELERKKKEDNLWQQREDKFNKDLRMKEMAAMWIQAHWKGVKTRKEMEKVTKKKKGKKKK